MTLTVITLSYGDGKPFAFEQYEVTPQGSEIPSQVGRTDALGRAAILPVFGQTLAGQSLAGQSLEIVATTKDGHGARLTLPATDAGSAPSASPPPPKPTFSESPRWMQFATGAGILFGLFGLLQLFTRRKEAAK
jgi:nickel transport protein